MFWLNLLLVIVNLSSVFGGLLERPPNFPCKLDDANCLRNTTDWVVSTTISGISQKGLSSLDPLNYESIEGFLGYIQYKLTKPQIQGMKTCRVSRASFNSNATTMHMELMCRRAQMDAEYDIKGELLGYPLSGIGRIHIETTNYLCSFDTDITYYKRDTSLYLKHEKYRYECELLGELDVDIKTLDGKKKKLPATALNLIQLAKSNAKLFASLMDDPIHYKNTKILMKNLNKRLELVPITDLIQIDQNRVKIGIL